MIRLFDIFSQIVDEGLFPCLKVYIDFLMGDGLFLGLGIIVLPLLARVVNIFKKML